jgi:hypothetical protein
MDSTLLRWRTLLVSETTLDNRDVQSALVATALRSKKFELHPMSFGRPLDGADFIYLRRITLVASEGVKTTE